MKSAKAFLGCQVWLEPDDSAERIDHLFARAAESGLGWARIFLMWPWIEPQPDVWLWSGQTVNTSPDGEIALPMPDGVGLLWQRD